MSTMSSPSVVEEAGARRCVAIRCIVEHVDTSTEHGPKSLNGCRREVDTVVRLPGQCPFDEIVIMALQKLGYSTKDMTGAKGSLQFPNWNSLSCDAVTDNLEATVESILGGVASQVTLRIRLQGRAKFSDQDNVKEKLLSALLQRLQTVLNNSGCPITQTLLNEISDGDFVQGLASSTQQAFDKWFRDQVAKPSFTTDRLPPNHHNHHHHHASTEYPESAFPGSPAAATRPRVGDGPGDAIPSTGPQHWTSQGDPSSLPSSPTKDDDAPSRGNDWGWRETDSKQPPLREKSEFVPPEAEAFRNSNPRFRILPNRNAVYEADADLPTSPEPPEAEAVVVVTPEMPLTGNNDDDDGGGNGLPPGNPSFSSSSSFSAYQNEPTDLSMRRIDSYSEGSGGISPLSHSRSSSSEFLKPFMTLDGQVKAEYLMSGGRTSSPLLLPPSLPSVFSQSAVGVTGFQSHLVHLHHQQQHALQLAAMSRALNFHFGPGIHHHHHLKGLSSRGGGVTGGGVSPGDRAPFSYAGGGIPGPMPCHPGGLLQMNADKAAAAAASPKDQKKRSRVFIDPLTEIPKLERWFAEDTHPSSYVIEKFTEELNRSAYRQRFPKLEPKNLQLWFKNHRAKMKRHRDVVPAHQVVIGNPGGGQGGFDVVASARTPSPGTRCLYSDWCSSNPPGYGKMMTSSGGKVGGGMLVTSSRSPSSSSGSRVISPAVPEVKSVSDCSDDGDDDDDDDDDDDVMEVSDADKISQKDMDE